MMTEATTPPPDAGQPEIAPDNGKTNDPRWKAYYAAFEARHHRKSDGHEFDGGLMQCVDAVLTTVTPLAPPREVTECEICGEAYQAVGVMANALGYWDMKEDDPDQIAITKLLDNLCAAAKDRPPPHNDLLPFKLTAALDAPSTETPREVTEAMVELAAREMHTINVEEANADRKAHGLALPEKWADPFESPSMARQLAKLKREATRIVTAALNAPARTASDLNIERQVAGLDDIDRDDAAKWRAVSAECEKAGCCLLNAPARVGENADLLAAAKEFVRCVRRNTLPDDTTKNLGWLFGHMEWEHLCEAVDTAAARERAMVDVTKAPESEHPIFRRLRWEFKIALEYSKPGHPGWRIHEAQLELIESLLREFGQRGELAARERGYG
jgi:hypothetical protein